MARHRVQPGPALASTASKSSSAVAQWCAGRLLMAVLRPTASGENGDLVASMLDGYKL